MSTSTRNGFVSILIWLCKGLWDVERDGDGPEEGFILKVYVNLKFSKITIWKEVRGRGLFAAQSQLLCINHALFNPASFKASSHHPNGVTMAGRACIKDGQFSDVLFYVVLMLVNPNPHIYIYYTKFFRMLASVVVT
ncbi:hypothetical protein GQ457_05G000110 [Hibiscus cannabinus]